MSLVLRSAKNNLLQQVDNSEIGKVIVAYRGDKNGSVKDGWKPRSGYVYSVCRSISARVNENFDAWPSAELKKSYRSFIGKPIFVNHANENPSKARGVVIAARYVENGHDKYIETIMETDSKRFPILAKELRTGGIDSVSMGVEAGWTRCSLPWCKNAAQDLPDMCQHVKFHKGEYLKDPKTGKRHQVWEDCFKLGFFELSFVFDPADPTAVVSRVIAANKRPSQQTKTATDYQPIGWDRHAPSNGKQQAFMGDGHSLHVFPPHQVAPIHDPGNFDELAPGSGSNQHEWVHTHHGEPVNGGFASSQQNARAQAEQSHKDLTGGWDPESDPFDPRQFGASKNEGAFMSYWYKKAFGETEAPEQIDTLRQESEDDTDLFHHWVQSPAELRAPDMDQTKQLDRAQENEGLDGDRHAEDAEEFSAPSPAAAPEPQEDQQFLDEQEDNSPVMPINPPEYKKSRRTKRSNRMSRYYHAADDDDDSADSGGDDVQDLLDEAEDDIDSYEDDGDDTSDYGDDDSDDGDSDSDDDGGPPWADDDEDDKDDTEDADDDDDDKDSDDSGPPWAEKESYFRPTVRRKSSRGNKRGGSMRTTLASRNPKGRHFTADDGHTDGGVHGEYDGSGADESQGLQEDVFISQVPNAEAVVAPADDESNISNTPNNLVAKYQRADFDPAHYQRLADVVQALPLAQRKAVASEMVRTFKADNSRFNELTFYKEAGVPMTKKGNRFFFAEDLVDPDKADPTLSGTDCQDLKGDDFESLALDNVETQPKDASIHKFQAFDQWLYQTTGRTAAQHGNANYISRMAASYCKAYQNPQAKLATLFPTLEYVLHEARKVEGRNAMRRSAEDVSLETAAPDGRVDVEAPVKNVTDEKAQASQFDLSDFAHNAGDQLADPVLDVVDGNAGTWAPDEGTKQSSRKLASGTEAMRCAEAYVHAMPNTYRSDDRWRLAAMFEGKLASAVRADMRLLEAVLEDRKKKTARKVTAATSRGTIPQGLGSRRSASRKLSVNDPDTDGALFM